MEKIRIVIIDDETPARELIKHYLKEVESIEVIAECSDGFSGLKTIISYETRSGFPRYPDAKAYRN